LRERERERERERGVSYLYKGESLSVKEERVWFYGERETEGEEIIKKEWREVTFGSARKKICLKQVRVRSGLGQKLKDLFGRFGWGEGWEITKEGLATWLFYKEGKLNGGLAFHTLVLHAALPEMVWVQSQNSNP